MSLASHSKFKSYPRIGKRVVRQLKNLKPLVGGEWDLKTNEVKEFKAKIKIVLNHIQNKKCAYCGLSLYETSGSQLEHIAPKGGAKRPKHVELTFTLCNLCLACSFCNGFNKKSTTETVSKKDVNYSLYSFNIVHPHFDDPSDHFDWVVDESKVVIQHKSLKGQKSISIFKLASPSMTEARTKQKLYENMSKKLADGYSSTIAEVLNYRGT